MGAKQVISQSKLRVSARTRVLEMENSPLGNTRENFVTERSPRAAGKGAAESLRDRGGIGWKLCHLFLRGLRGLQVPAARPGPLGSALHLGLPAARGRVSDRLAPSARGSMAWGGGVPSRPPRRRGQASGTGTSASARAGGPAAGDDRKLSSQRRGRLFLSRRRGLRGLSGGGGGFSRLAGRRRSPRDRRETLAVSGVLARARSRRRKPPAVGPGDRLLDRCFLKYVNISCESKVVV